jgi:hypothetical protein
VRLAVALIAALLVAAPEASAQPAGDPGPADQRDEAREIAKQGLAKLDAGDARGAITLFERAEAKFHAPTHLLYLAQAHASLGEKLAAARFYQRLISEALPNYAPDAFREAQRIGRTELASLSPGLGRIKIEGGTSGVSIDGEPVEGELTFVLPGHHEVKLPRGARSVDVGAGFEVVVGPVSAVPGPSVSPPSREPEGLRPLVVGGIVTMSIGGAAAIAGAVLGGLSLTKVDQLDDRCPEKRGCDPGDEAIADDARALGDGSTALLAIGGATFVAGLVLVLIPTETSASKRSTAPGPFIGPGRSGLQIRF